jgi:hypothetical protein
VKKILTSRPIRAGLGTIYSRRVPDLSYRFVLIIGGTAPEGVISHLRTTGRYYTRKRLDSSPKNWESIIELAQRDTCSGAVVKLTSRGYATMVREDYEKVADRLLAALGEVPHIVFVHESVLTGREVDIEPGEPDEDDLFDEYDDYGEYLRSLFTPPEEETRLAVNEKLDANRINVVPYRTNAEMGVLAAAFVEDSQNNLLLRIYVPKGRLYATEADRLLTLFCDWVGDVKGQRVRQDGYKTPSGRVYEVFGDGDLASSNLSLEFGTFSRFLDLCVEEPAEAVESLIGEGVQRDAAEDIVRRYGKESKRLDLDLQQALESRTLSIRHRLQSELLDLVDPKSIEWQEVEAVAASLIPRNVAPALGPVLAPTSTARSSPVSVTINQQIIQTVEGTVVQAVQGTMNIGPQAKDLLRLIQEFGGADASSLESDALELEDVDARAKDRLAAKQRLKGFLFKLGGRVEETVLTILQRYIEGKIGAGGGADARR